MDTYEYQFHHYPNINPITKKKMIIGSKEYMQFVNKYGYPTIISPETHKQINVGGQTYIKLIEKGHQEEDLLHTLLPIKSPKTKKQIKQSSQTYKKLLKEGYFCKFNWY